MFDTQSNVNFEEAVNIYFFGKKSQYLRPNINRSSDEGKKEKEKKEKEKKIIKILQNSMESEPVNEINLIIERIKNDIDINLNNLTKKNYDLITIIEDYGEYFKINELLKDLEISLPLTVDKVIEKVSYKSRHCIYTDVLEKCFYICQIFKFLYNEKLIEFYKRIKEKINQAGIEDIFLLNDVKNQLIMKAREGIGSIQINKNLIQDVWNKLKNDDRFVNNENLNKKIVSYVKANNPEKFLKDLSKICGEYIKEINLKDPDPQNLYLKAFMNQNEIYYEVK
jgi:hypothetical protein